jgi:hypothetical protein
MRRSWIALLGLVGFGGIAMVTVGVALLGPGSSASAQAPTCSVSHAGITEEEWAAFGKIKEWRASQRLDTTELQLSGPLNRAAAWYAEHSVREGPFAEHLDAFGRKWGQRALDCGYTVTTSGGVSYALRGSGEAYYAAVGSNVPDIGATQGVQLMTYPGSGLWFPPASPPVKCIGVAKYRSSRGVAWVAVIAQHPAGSDCPERVTGPDTLAETPTASPSPSLSPTPTATPTATPSPSPTPDPTPATWFRFVPGIAADG